MTDFRALVDMDDSVEASFGLSSDLIPSGWYPLVIDTAEVDETQNGLPRAHVTATVTDGPRAGRKVFVDVFMAAGKTRRASDGSEVMRTVEEFEKANKSTQGMMNGLLKALGVHKNKAVAEGGDLKLFMAMFYNVAQWPTRKFVGRLEVSKGRKQADGSEGKPRHNLREYVPLDDPKHGLEAWKVGAWGLPKQVKEDGVAKGSGGAAGAPGGVTL